MKKFCFSEEYDICAELNIDWEKIDNKSILITGSTGMVGTYLIHVLLRRNQLHKLNTKIIAVGRSKENFKKRFQDVPGADNVLFYRHDVQKPFDYKEPLDFIIHMASNTHPRLYATDPIGTEMINIFGSYNLLELASVNPGCRFVFTSSGDIYGDNRSGKNYLEEKDCGYIDCNTLRAGYIEGKRASEALCNAYKESRNVDFVIARLCRIYGPTMTLSDSKAISQFIKNAAAGDDIVMKSKGNQIFSYLYIFDVVSALLTIIAQGINGGAYNVAANNQFISLADLAAMLANIGDCSIVYDFPDSVEAKGASSFQNVKLDASRLYGLGWTSRVDLYDGLKFTVEQLRKRM